MILGYFILAHLLGDFVFQPSILVKWKMRSDWGVLVHIIVHVFCNLLVFLPILINGYYWVLPAIFFIPLAHFFIDKAKISYSLRHDKMVKPFVIDQLLHFFAILLAFFFLINYQIDLPHSVFYDIYINQRFLAFLSLIIFLSVTLEIYHYEKTLEHHKNAKLKIRSKNVVARVFVFAAIYLLFMIMAYFAG